MFAWTCLGSGSVNGRDSGVSIQLSKCRFCDLAPVVLTLLLASGCKAGPSGESLAHRSASSPVGSASHTASQRAGLPADQPSAAVADGGKAVQQPQHEAESSVTITVVLDNRPYDKRLRCGWGFAALVEHEDTTVLFDTGPDGQALLFNLQHLDFDPARIHKVALSHIHGDHTGGMEALLGIGARPTVYLLPSFPPAFKRRLAARAEVVEVTPKHRLGPTFFSTGELGGGVPEQGLVIRTSRGLVLMTGCAHPGVVSMTKRAQELFGGHVYMVIGGFHLLDKRDAELDRVASEFRRLGVEKVAPCHCTGDRGIEKLAQAYGDGFIRVGTGRKILVQPRS
jgi:7,8-dihydropterin-6-yl-methyl-4-(beta-D-ribofuranosyl)aminobenzene 5'-phosphate synthase